MQTIRVVIAQVPQGFARAMRWAWADCHVANVTYSVLGFEITTLTIYARL